MILLHGFADTPQTWERVLPLLPGASAPPLPRADTADAMLDALEERLPDGLVDVVGNSLGGWLALKLAERGRARSVVAFAPAGGWAGDAYKDLLERQRLLPGASTALIDAALRDGWPVEPERITCPVRVVWGTADPLLPCRPPPPLPARLAAARRLGGARRRGSLPAARAPIGGGGAHSRLHWVT